MDLFAQDQDEFIVPEDVEATENALERVRDELGLENKYQAAVVANQVRLGRLERQQTALLQQLTDVLGRITPDGTITLPDAFPWEFSTDVPSDTPVDSPVTTERSIPDGARLTSLTVGWPSGADNTAGVQFGPADPEDVKYFPRNTQDDYIAANDFTDTWPLRVNPQDDVLVAQFVNGDTTNNHFINVIAMLELREPVDVTQFEGFQQAQDRFGLGESR